MSSILAHKRKIVNHLCNRRIGASTFPAELEDEPRDRSHIGDQGAGNVGRGVEDMSSG